METVRATASIDPVDALQAAAEELGRLHTVPHVAEAALRLTLELTRSRAAFLALADERGDGKRIFSKSCNPTDRLTDADIEHAVASASSAGLVAVQPLAASSDSQPSSSLRTTSARPLEAGGESIGIIGIATPVGYTAAQLQAFSLLAHQVASALAIAQLNERRQGMVDALVNLRADLDRSERQRLVNDERARGAERVEQAHDAAVAALLAISRHARTRHGLTDFHRGLTRSIAELVGARKVLFWECSDEGTLAPIPGAYAIDDEFLSGLGPVPCAPDRDDLVSRIVFHDLMFRAARNDQSREFRSVLEILRVSDAIAVSWRAGDQRLGMVTAFESVRAEGFSREDTWVLQKGALAAGLVWQLKYADVDLKKTIERLEKVDAARQMLLKNVSTAVEKARKRFASDLHDDALQKLTAVELHLQRLHDPNGDATELLAEAQVLLAQTEDALRRLLFEVRPPALEVPGGFVETIRERVRMLKATTGADVELEVDIPNDLSFEFRSMLYRQVTEAVTNIEKHASAAHVWVSLATESDAVHGIVRDDGRGFVVAERDRLPGHLGLLALNERPLLAGGWNKILSEPGLGTTIEFWLPLSEKEGQP